MIVQVFFLSFWVISVDLIQLQTGCAGLQPRLQDRTAATDDRFTELAQSRTGARGNNKSDKWNNIFKFYLRNYDHQQSFDT